MISCSISSPQSSLSCWCSWSWYGALQCAPQPVPARTTHNTLLEIAWTTVPIVILLVIAVPSFKLLFFQLIPPPADLTVKATGKQWYWSYGYPDAGQIRIRTP